MGAKFRAKKSARTPIPVDNAIYARDGIVQSHEAYKPELYQNENTDYAGGNEATYGYDSPEYPIGTERWVTEASGSAPMPTPVGSIKDQIDWEIGGQRGRINPAMAIVGPVSSDSVENFWLGGQQAVIRRKLDDNYGPVGQASEILQLAYAQQAAQLYPNEASRANLVMGA